jgi:hypothetical protein
MSKKLSLALATVVALFLVALLVFFFFSTRPVTNGAIGLTYSLGGEIENYPIPELSTNFTSWNMTTKLREFGVLLDPGNETLFVLVNFTIRNTTNKTINLFDQNLSSGLASTQTPSLCYEGQTGEGKYVSGSSKSVGITGSWLNHLHSDEPVVSNGLMNANETAKGLLVYTLTKGYGASGLDINYSSDLSIFVELTNPTRDNSIG